MGENNNGFGGWRVTVFWLGIAAAAAIAGVVFGWSWRGRTGALADVRLLDAMMAFGTVGTALVAVAVPLYQNWDRRQEQRRDQLKAERALAEEVHRISSRLRRITDKLLCSTKECPSRPTLEHLQSQLCVAKQATTDRLGRLIIDDLLHMAVLLSEDAERYSIESAKQPKFGMRQPIFDLSQETKTAIDGMPAICEAALHWMDRVISSLESIGAIVSSSMKASGAAKVNFQSGG